jgi:hypothetical protein
MTESPKQPIHAGCVRIIVRLGHRQAAGDFMAQALPEWLLELERSAERCLIRGTQEGVMIARGLALEGFDTGQWAMAYLASLWIVLYSPTPTGANLADLMALADTGVITIIVSADGSTWYCDISQIGGTPGPAVH